jgi:hypothetical protein
MPSSEAMEALETMLDLLRASEKLMFARYGVLGTDGMDLVVASVGRSAETLEHRDLLELVGAVALAAHRIEEHRGAD